MKNSKIKIGDFCVFWNNKWSSPIIGFLDEQVIQNESSTCIAKCLWKTCDFVFEYCVKYSELPNIMNNDIEIGYKLTINNDLKHERI